MEHKLLGIGLALLMLAALPMASGYHIDGSATPVADPNGGPNLSTSDWIMQGDFILCETEGPQDDLNTAVGPTGQPGTGGLCYTGRNDATGTYAPGANAGLAAGCETVLLPLTLATVAPPCPPGYSDFTRLDTCSTTIPVRSGGGYGPFAFATAAGCNGSQNDHAWFGRVGTIGCDVAPTEALYYSERYAWWTYEFGSGDYSSGDAAGQAHQGMGGVAPARRDAYHGHAEMFVSLPFSVLGASTTGSAVTTAVAPPFLGLYLDCGASPGPDPFNGAPSGPLFRGP